MFMIYINKFVGARIFAQARDTTKVADNGLPNYAINNDVKRVKKVENRVYLQTRNSGQSVPPGRLIFLGSGPPFTASFVVLPS